MPGRAGNFVSRLFSLGPETMPLIRQSMMTEYIDHGLAISDTFDRLENYQFSTVSTEFNTWQEFHRAYADHKEYIHYRLLNVFCNRKYSRIVFPLHPYEFDQDFLGDEDSEFYYVDLDLEIWKDWVDSEQQKLKFQVRSLEEEQFEYFKHQYSMKSISLTQLLESNQTFVQEYQRVCTEMQISPLLEQALILRKDWYSTRVNQL